MKILRTWYDITFACRFNNFAPSNCIVRLITGLPVASASAASFVPRFVQGVK
ncbi:hypothetical protein [Croceibacterium ferulae]|uniref:hypothetical protein n=1 Tax=Croceibacterium ferulae TaxID=1854641 RepID=UPI0012D791D7|nr:hypothetical protein [Croceibacterium ferulae]